MSTPAAYEARVARALEILAPPGVVRVLLLARVTERSAEQQEALRSTVGDPPAGLLPVEVAEHRRNLERHGLLHATSAGLEATSAAKELWPPFLAAAAWASTYRSRLIAYEHVAFAVEEVLGISAQPLTVFVLAQLRDAPATEDDLARPMTAAARAQLPDQLSVFVEQELLWRLPNSTLEATAAGQQLAKVHDELAYWYGQYMPPAVQPGPRSPRRAAALASPARTAGEEPASLRPPAAAPTADSPVRRL